MDSSDESGYETSGETEEQGGELLEAVDAGIRAIKAQMKEGKYEKAALTDLVRLLQLRKELKDDLPRYISVRWIDDDE